MIWYGKESLLPDLNARDHSAPSHLFLTPPIQSRHPHLPLDDLSRVHMSVICWSVSRASLSAPSPISSGRTTSPAGRFKGVALGDPQRGWERRGRRARAHQAECRHAITCWSPFPLGTPHPFTLGLAKHTYLYAAMRQGPFHPGLRLQGPQHVLDCGAGRKHPSHVLTKHEPAQGEGIVARWVGPWTASPSSL